MKQMEYTQLTNMVHKAICLLQVHFLCMIKV